MTHHAYQSPISPGRSWYEDSCGERPTYPALDGDRACDVLVIGGGYCGLAAARELALAGTSVVLVEQARLGDGASGRNGGQMGSGPRASVLELETEFGQEKAKALWGLAADAKTAMLALPQDHGVDIGFIPGQLTPMHKRRYEKEAREKVDALNARYDYPEIKWLDQRDMARALGSDTYFGGTRDSGTGHIHPMKTVIGLGSAAARAGAILHEQTAISSLHRQSATWEAKTRRGTIRAAQVIVATNAHHEGLLPELAARIWPIRSFIGATVPLPADTPVLPGGEAVDDSRFVVRYFRKSADNRLLFGGREVYGRGGVGNIEAGIRWQMCDIYPGLEDVAITHAWGGSVGITPERMPFVREMQPGLWAAGGFSGHGVMHSHYTGMLMARRLLGTGQQIDVLRDLPISRFPGGRLLRNPLTKLALAWYALVDRV